MGYSISVHEGVAKDKPRKDNEWQNGTHGGHLVQPPETFREVLPLLGNSFGYITEYKSAPAYVEDQSHSQSLVMANK